MKEKRRTDRISTYFIMEKWTLLVVLVSGIIYNVGLTAGPWFEGKLAQKLFDIMEGKAIFDDMVRLAVLYSVVIFLVQFSRFFKRLYVRKFANHVNRSMKLVLYDNMVNENRQRLENEGVGNIMTKAISDVDTCVEGMRKFTTEVFDTGVVMVAYMVMLLVYDWRLALISFIFPPVAYIMAEKLKVFVAKNAAAYKESAGELNRATLDRTDNAITYRVYGQESNQEKLYEDCLKNYEVKAVRANIWETSMQPIYEMISMMSMIFILYFGIRNVLHTGWTQWDIASFSTFMACYTRLAVKSSKAAKLFNSVQKARVSWKRIHPFLESRQEQCEQKVNDRKMHDIEIRNLGVKFDDYIFKNVSLKAVSGQIIGVTGAVACGKSTFGRAVLGDVDFEGDVIVDGEKISGTNQYNPYVTYMGHKPELLTDSIKNNILLGEEGDMEPYLKLVAIDEEVKNMEAGVDTLIGNGGVRLSGGQQARIALARTLFHRKPVIILDDPFSAVDKATEKEIFDNLKKSAGESIIFIISHRLDIFPQFDNVIWMGENGVTVSKHEKLIKNNAEYERLYSLQMGGDVNEQA